MSDLAETCDGLEAEARKALGCLFIAVPEEVAADVERKVLASLDAKSREIAAMKSDPRMQCPLDGPGSHRADLAELRLLQSSRASTVNEKLLAACEEMLAIPERRRAMEKDYPAGTCNAEDAWDGFDNGVAMCEADLRREVATARAQQQDCA